MLIKCPACYQKIGPYDRSCPCGWSVSESMAPPSHNCGWPDCTGAAASSVMAAGKRVNLCMMHYAEYHRRQANAGAKAKGLNTPEACREWLKQNKLRSMKFPNYEVRHEIDK